MIPTTKSRKSERSRSSFSPSFVPGRGFSVSINIPLVKQALNNRRLIRHEKKWTCPVFCERTAVVRIKTRVANQLAESQFTPQVRPFAVFSRWYIFSPKLRNTQQTHARPKGKKEKERKHTHGRASRQLMFRFRIWFPPTKTLDLIQFLYLSPRRFFPSPLFSIPRDSQRKT